MADLADLGMRFSTEGGEQAVKVLDGVAAKSAAAEKATDALAKTSAGAKKATDALTAAQRDLISAYGQTGALNQKLVQGVGGYAAAQKLLETQLTKTATAHRQVTASAGTVSQTYEHFFNGNFVDQWAKQAAAVAKTGQAYKLTQGQVQEGVSVIRHSIDQLAVGANLLTVLASHISSLGQAAGSGPGGLAGAFSALGKVFSPTVLGFGLITAAAVATTAALLAYDDTLQHIAQTTAGVGRQSGLSALQIEKLAQANAPGSGASVADARALEAQLLQTGKVGGQVFATLIQIQQKYANATGQDLPKAQAELAKAIADPVKGLDLLSDKLSGVDARTQELVTSLMRQGRTFEAQVTLAKAFQASLAGVDSTTQTLGGQFDALARFLGSVATGYADAITQARAFIALGPAGVAAAKAQQEAAAQRAQGQALVNNASRAGGDLFLQLNPDAAARQKLQQNLTTASQGVAATSFTGDFKGVQQTTDALLRATQASQSYIPVEQKLHQLSLLDAQANGIRAKAETAATRAQLGAIAAQRTRIELSGQYLTKAEVEQRAADAAAEASSKQSRASASHADQLAREAAATIATTAATFKLADAYAVSDAAALRAQARVEAIGRAIKDRGDVEADVQRQLNLNAAKEDAAAAKSQADLTFETTARSNLNAQVRAGTITLSAANDELGIEAKLRPLIAAAQVASADKQATLTRRITEYRAALEEANATARETATLAAHVDATHELEYLQAEIDLLGKSNRERTVQLALLKATQDAEGRGNARGSAAQIEALFDAQKAGDKSADLAQGQNNYNASLNQTLNILTEIAAQSTALGSSLSGSVGQAGSAIGGLISTLSQYSATQERIRVDEAAARKAASNDATALANLDVLYAKKRQTAEVESNLAALDSFKSLFGQKTAAYKVLQGLEIAYQAVQLAGHIKELAMSAVSTATSIANSIRKGVAAAAAGAAKMFEALGPFGFAAVAAMVAVLGAMGLGALSHGGGGASGPSAEDLQKAAGTGSVLGDPTAKSDSIAKSLEIVAANSNKDLEYFNPMLKALRNIDNNIGLVAASLARQLGAGGAFDTSGLNLGKVSNGPGLLQKILNPISAIFPGLFGTTKTTTLLDQGIQFDPQNLADLLSGGIEGSTYQTTATDTKKKFFGITYSNKTKTNTATEDLDQELSRQLTQLVGSLQSGILSAAGAIGLEGAQAVLDAFQVNIGTLSFKDMTGEEIQQQLEAVFGKLADDMTAAVFPAISELQKVGEGAFETLARVARDYQVIDVTLSSIGKTFGAIGVSSLAARESLIDLFGSIDDFVSQTQFFRENFLSKAEQIAPVQAAVQKEFARLGVTGVNTIDQFKKLVLGLDLTTQAGQEMYASLLAVAPAFKEVFDYLNPDAASAAADGWRDVFQSMQDWIRTLNGEIASSVQSTAQAYAALQAAALAARGGDLAAAGQVVDLGKAYLDAARASAGSELEYLQAVARTRAIASSVQLSAASQAGIATGAASMTPFSPATSATGSIAPSYTYVPTSFDSTGSFMVAGSGPKDFGPVTFHGGEIVDVHKPYQSSNDNGELAAAIRALTAEMAGLKGDQRIGFTALASKVGQVVKQLDDWDGAGLPPSRDAEEAA